MPIKDPVIIIGCPRSGTTMLFTILSQSKELFSMYRESWNALRVAYDKGLLKKNTIDDLIPGEAATEEVIECLRTEFHQYSHNHAWQSFWTANHLRIPGLWSYLPLPNPLSGICKNFNAAFKGDKDYRFVEKTPRNCFRVDFMNKIFPDAKFVFISRDGKSNISSLIEGWKRNANRLNHKRFPEPGYEFEFSNFDYKKWEYVLPPGWEEFNGKSLEELCAWQWIQSNKYALDSLDKLDPSRVIKVRYEDLTRKTPETIRAITSFIGVPYEDKLQAFAEKPPVVSTSAFDKPREDKWKKNAEALERIEPMLDETLTRLGYKHPLESPV